MNFLLALIPGWARLLAAGVIVASVLGFAYAKGRMHVQAAWDEERRLTKLAQDESNIRAAQAGFKHLEWMAANAPKALKRKEELSHALQENTDWDRTAVPLGVQRAIEAAIQAGNSD
jgi:hypothetical protein